MITINKTQPTVTLVNPHVCKPERQQELTDLLVEAINTIYKNVTGFVSATIHQSSDGTRVTNYAQYRSREDVEAMWKANPAIPAFAKQIESVADSFDPHLYQVVETARGETAAETSGAATISKQQSIVTLIDVYRCKAEDQQHLTDSLSEAVKTIYSRLPGFVSASIHKSLDGVRVTNYAQWQALADFEAIKENESLASYRQKVGTLAESFDGMHIYKVVEATEV